MLVAFSATKSTSTIQKPVNLAGLAPPLLARDRRFGRFGPVAAARFLRETATRYQSVRLIGARVRVFA